LNLRNVPFSEPLKKNYPKALNQAISRYQSQGLLLGHHDGIETFYTLSEPGRISLNYYKNSLMHNLVSPALLSTLLKEAPPTVSREELESAYAEIASLYAREFIQILPFREASADLAALGGANEDDTASLRVASLSVIDSFAALFTNFLEAYQLTALGLKRLHFEKLEEKKVLRQILDLGHNLLLKGELTRPEALSQFSVQNALAAFREKGLIKTHEKELGKAGLKVYSTVDKPELLEEILRLLQGKVFRREEKNPPLYLLKSES